MPISNDCKSAFRHALESAERADSAWITRRHLLIGAARADAAIGKLLGEKNINPEEFPLPEDEDWQPTPTARVGIGYDFHRLAEGRPLILGGVEIPFGKGLVGHSDGDVLTHAVCDALLGAAGLGDLGQHFPDHDPRWKDASSLDLLARVVALLKERGLQIMQIDSVIVAEQPALAPHFARMREQLAKTLGIQPAQVNVKAKTTEGLEALGRGEAMAAQAVALLELRGTTLVS
jgi:2-C-methyl-D-erythritol 2,4-cyclodiphosphate synthase